MSCSRNSFRFSGKKLTLNFATSAAGGIRVELQQPDGKPISPA
ncbi:MAG: hypothetical protein U0903_05040 [Planctomycetales bacterium]